MAPAGALRAHWQILAGILVATLANHGLAALIGQEVAGLLDAPWFRTAVALGFIAMAAWTLVPDKLDDDDAPSRSHFGVFAATTWAFFLAEMGDKTQIATVALGAQYEPLIAVVVGTTLGMMLANAPVVFFGDAITRKVPIRAVHAVAAVIFAVLGVLALLGVGA